MELLVVFGFLVLLVAMKHQWDNPEMPYNGSNFQSFTELHDNEDAKYAHLDTSLKSINLPRYITKTKRSYLASIKWNTIRLQVLKRDNYTCRKCNATDIPLEVHHITYERFENEQLSDLVSVCRECHQSIHNKYGYMYTSTFPIH